MEISPSLRLKAKKASLSFLYVHDRHGELPTYDDVSRFFFQSLITCFVALLLVLISPLLITTASGLGSIAQQKVRHFIQWITPDPLPSVTVLGDVASAHVLAQKDMSEKWQQSLTNTSFTSVRSVVGIPTYLENHPDIFHHDISFADVRLFQTHFSPTLPQGFGNVAQASRSILAQNTSNPPSIFTSFGAQIALLRELENFHQIDIQNMLDQSIDRQHTLEQFLTTATHLEKTTERTLVHLTARRRTEESRAQTLQSLSNTKEQNVQQNLNSLSYHQTEGSLTEFISARQRTVDARAHVGVLQILEQRFAQQLPLLSQKIDAVENNKNALVANVQFTATPGIDLGLVRP